MSRTSPGALNQSIEARNFTSANNLVVGPNNWRGPLSSCTGGHALFGPVLVASGATAVLDDSLDFRDRLCLLFGHIAIDDLTDHRPGAAQEYGITPAPNALSVGMKGETLYTAAGWDGLGARGGVNRFNFGQFIDYNLNAYVNVYVYSDSTNGNRLTIKNASGQKVTGGIWLFFPAQPGQAVVRP